MVSFPVMKNGCRRHTSDRSRVDSHPYQSTTGSLEEVVCLREGEKGGNNQDMGILPNAPCKTTTHCMNPQPLLPCQ